MRLNKLTVAVALATSSLHSMASANETIEKITVTSRQVEESIQEIPLAVTALTGADIEQAGLEDLRDITHMIAGLQMDGYPGKTYTTPTIRGLAQVSRSDDENNTSIFIDGVYVSGRDGLDSSLLDLERIEVVKGPQGALYGRNSYAGAINFITRKASDIFESKVSATVGNYGKVKTSLMVTGPIAEGLYYRANMTYDDWDGGYENSNDGSDIGGYKSNFYSGSLRYDGIENFEANLNTYYSVDKIDVNAQAIVDGNCQAPTSAIFPEGYTFQRYCGEVPSLDRDDPEIWTFTTTAPRTDRMLSRTSLNMTYDFATTRLTSITGYNYMEMSAITDQDRQLEGTNYWLSDYSGYVTLPSYVAFGNQRHAEWSQELRLHNTNKSPLQWLVGASYYELKREVRSWFGIDDSGLEDGQTALTFYAPFTDLSGGFPSNLFDELVNYGGLTGDGTNRTKTAAVYGSLTYAINDEWTVRGELRLTEETKSLVDPVTVRDQEQDWTFVTPRASVDYQMTPDILFYGSVAQGVKSGGFNAPNASLPEEYESYDEETNWTYEIGMKSDWLDQRLRVNTAIFDVEMEGIQTSSQIEGTTVFTVQNAGEGRSRGFELEVAGVLNENLEAGFGYALADAKFTEAEDGNLASLVGVIDGIDSVSLNGQQLPRMSKHTFNAQVIYRTQVSAEMEGYARIDGRYESKKKGSNHDALDYVGARTVVNASIGVNSEKWEASLWVRNLFDNDTPLIAGSTLLLGDFNRLPTVAMGEPRTFGITGTYHF
ncbi:TonB-dependent receptor [Alteromonas sp. 1_MG-2023]|uniref:TonB-dependent receptor n=1 Tax=Alteromonas sp. 1_MG-2023 TaxID=3062669 RepID=UPI0026E31B06|nr:TonB-dependent receptor [Alteromonas sp. 1_MG-2023]MDO6475193.1 TonB-dependent receptor [Alteromonas sp. 1_MG-2023]